MTRVESALSTAWYNNISIQQRTSRAASSSPLASAKKAVSEALGEVGFVDIAGHSYDNFKSLLIRDTTGSDRETAEPDRYPELAASTARAIQHNPQESEQAQAHVPPQDAVPLLK